ncbi:DUF928 domain-containing protein [Almyronema epifaneia]|uniref:DUF928 domain-containing protein n=1 Tax=Almyronema epifaneia S1 TaxID=2991925 RepID=A0ABW6IDH9_9CYAN
MRRITWCPLFLSAALAVSGLPLASSAATASIQAGIGTLSENHQEVLLAGYRGFRLRVRTSRYRSGGFRRGGSCLVNQGDQVAVVAPPARSEEVESTLTGLAPSEVGPVDVTASAHPTFLVNVPDLEGAATAELTIQHEDYTRADAEVVNMSFELNGQPGIVAIQVPQSETALEPGSKYLWQLAIKCESESALDNSSNLVVDSWIEREAIDASPTGSLQDQLAFYAERGIWQETAGTLAQLRYQFPDDPAIASDWQALMQDVGLDEFAAVPVVQMVQ